MNEWTQVPGFPHIEVTRSGRVSSSAFTVTRKSRWGSLCTYSFKAREYRPRQEKPNGYVRVVILRDGKRGPLYVHRLIAFEFVPGYKTGYHVNHIDGVKWHNNPENLEWVPIEENLRHARRTGLSPDMRGEKNPMNKLSAKQVRAIRKALGLGIPLGVIATIASVARRTIRAIRDGATWQSVAD